VGFIFMPIRSARMVAQLSKSTDTDLPQALLFGRVQPLLTQFLHHRRLHRVISARERNLTLSSPHE
jgi:hypothetical protein